MRNGIWNFGVRWRDGWNFVLGRKNGLWTGDRASVYWQLDSSIINVEIKIARKYMEFQWVEGIDKIHVVFARANSFSFCDLSCTEAYNPYFSHQKQISVIQKHRHERPWGSSCRSCPDQAGLRRRFLESTQGPTGAVLLGKQRAVQHEGSLWKDAGEDICVRSDDIDQRRFRGISP